MEPFNLYSGELDYNLAEPEGYRAGWKRFGPLIGAAQIGGTVYELEPGQSNCPYHYEYGREEWLIVLDGTATVRHPDGERSYVRGDVVCFPEGPDGAHQLLNTSDATARLLMLSTISDPSVAVYPDSDKIGVFPGDDRDEVMFQRASGVDYWEGES
jgi:uncharacterized cupin superfamily protein